LIQGYDIASARDDDENKPLTPLKALLIVTPFPSLNLRGSAGWDHYEHEFSQATLSGNLSVNRSGGRKDTYELNYQYYQGSTTGQTNVNFQTNINLIYGLSVGGWLQRDMEKNKNISTAGWVGFQRQCWGLKLGASREMGNTDVIVVLRLIGLGDTGKW